MLKDNLKAVRKQRKISQRELAKISGVSYSMVSKLESGEQNNPSLETIEKVAGALNVTAYELMGWGYFDTQILASGINVEQQIHNAKKAEAYLHTLGYSVTIEQSAKAFEKEPQYKNGKVIGYAQMPVDEKYEVILTKGAIKATLSKEEYESLEKKINELQNDMRDIIELRIQNKAIEQQNK